MLLKNNNKSLFKLLNDYIRFLPVQQYLFGQVNPRKDVFMRDAQQTLIVLQRRLLVVLLSTVRTISLLLKPLC